MDYYMLGMIFGIVIAVGIALIAWFIKRKQNPNSWQFDERQVIGRGKAFQAGFFTTLAASAAVSIWEYIEGSLPGIPFLWHIGALLFGVLVFALTAIHFDAYVGMNENPGKFTRTGVIFTIAMILIAIANLTNGREEGFVTGILNLFIAGMWAAIVAALLLHRKASQEDEE